MTRLLILLFFSAPCLTTIAQENADTASFNDYSYLDKHFFSIRKLGWCGGTTGAMDRSYTFTDANNKSSQVHEKFNTVWISIVSIGYDARLNLLDFDDKASLSISVPADLSLGLAISNDDEINSGFLALSSGLFLEGNYGNHATYNNIDKNGLSLGLGLRVMKAPLLGSGMLRSKRDNEQFDRLAFGPSIRLMFKTDKANKGNKGFALETGIPKRVEGIAGPSNLYLRISVISLLNY